MRKQLSAPFLTCSWGQGCSSSACSSVFSLRKMSAGLLLLLCAAAVLCPAGARSPYDELPDAYRPGVDLVLEQLSSHASVQHHFVFLRSLEKMEIEGSFGVKYLNHHFYLKPTKCAKGALKEQHCPYRNDRPLMDCLICYKTISGRMDSNPRPYVHCMQKPRITQEMKATRLAECKKISYNPGAPTILALSTG
uniref:Retinoic acid receptor responder protein 2 n=1 Tax=Oryzias latipes TaxID=8090 RepID=A0A3P9KDZ0_ORYLA